MSKRLCEGTIFKALSGFYDVETDERKQIRCRGRGRFRQEKISPLVGDRVLISETEPGKGMLEDVLPRKNAFIRPPVANLDLMVILAAGVNPITDTFLIDRICAVTEHNCCDVIICINKCDLDTGDRLFSIYEKAGFFTIRTSAVTGEGIDALREAIKGKICSFVGNSGVGKSSILSALEPGFVIKTAQVSEKLGRGRHTTRHTQLYKLSNGAVVADTPGFSSFDTESMELLKKDDLQYAFREFRSYTGKCLFHDCAHVGEKGCAIADALCQGELGGTRHESYVRLYQHAKQIKEWQRKKE